MGGLGVGVRDPSDYLYLSREDYGFAGNETEGYDDDGGGVGGSECEKREPGSD